MQTILTTITNALQACNITVLDHNTVSNCYNVTKIDVNVLLNHFKQAHNAVPQFDNSYVTDGLQGYYTEYTIDSDLVMLCICNKTNTVSYTVA